MAVKTNPPSVPPVEYGIPIPSRRRDRSVTHQLKMRPGGSILIRGARGASDSDVTAWSQMLRRKGYVITSRSLPEGVRIWRIS